MVLEELESAKEVHPNALVVIHPEARQELLDQADVVTSTSGMVRMAAEHDELIIGTEMGLVDKLQKEYPEKTFVPLLQGGHLREHEGEHPSEAGLVPGPSAVRGHHGRGDPSQGRDVSLRRMLEVSGGWKRPRPTSRSSSRWPAVRTSGCGCG